MKIVDSASRDFNVKESRAEGLVGSALFSPATPVIAGSYGTWHITYRVGRLGMNDGSRIKITRHWASDWGTPQFDRPQEPEYVSATTPGNAKIRLAYDPKGYIRPWQKTIVVDIYDGYLSEAETVTVIVGDTSAGSPGSRAQTFYQECFRFRFLVDCLGTGNFVEIPLDGVHITSDEVNTLKVIVPSTCGRGDKLWALVKAEDMWGNPCDCYSGDVELEACPEIEGLPGTVRFTDRHRGVVRIENIKVAKPARYVVKVADRDRGLYAESNPLECNDTPPLYQPFWGDLQGQSEEDIGTGSLESFFEFARDKAPLDFVSHQPNDFNVTDEQWKRMQVVTRQFHEPDRFVPLLGMEWSATSAAGGDHNLIYFGDTAALHRSSHWQVPTEPGWQQDRTTVRELLDQLRKENVIAIPHVGGRRAPMALIDPDIMPLVEIYSCWGSFEWVIDDALARGHRVGFVANSDGHSGRPGAEYPGASDHFGVRGGLTCAYAKRLTRDGLREAFKSRRTYATTGERIIMKFESDGHWMGAEYATATPPRLSFEVTGTADLEAVSLMRGTEVIGQWRATTDASSNVIRITWGGARGIDRNKTTVWDGRLWITNARILNLRPYAMDTPVKKFVQTDASTVAWQSSTVGDFDGVELAVDACGDSVLHFESPLITFAATLKDISGEPMVWDAGGVRQQVRLERLPAFGLGRTLRIEHVDEGIKPGWNAYYVKAVQADGHMGWASPIYVLSN